MSIVVTMTLVLVFVTVAGVACAGCVVGSSCLAATMSTTGWSLSFLMSEVWGKVTRRTVGASVVRVPRMRIAEMEASPCGSMICGLSGSNGR